MPRRRICKEARRGELLSGCAIGYSYSGSAVARGLISNVIYHSRTADEMHPTQLTAEATRKLILIPLKNAA